VELAVPYSVYEPVKRLVADHGGRVEAESFTTNVVMRLTFAIDDLPAFAAAVSEATSGQVAVTAGPFDL
jgi:putative IMPACT (imprinted ancient) family translation regulator